MVLIYSICERAYIILIDCFFWRDKMFIGSHIKIGSYVYSHLKLSHSLLFKLDRISFIYGNVKPDIHPSLYIYDHFFETTRDILDIEIKKICNPLLDDKIRSIALGVLCHFISDYNCTYHARMPYKKQSMPKHFAYELLLHSRFLYFLSHMKTLKKSLSSITYTPLDQVNTSIQKCLWDYYNMPSSMDNDVLFTLHNTLEICRQLVIVESASTKRQDVVA